MSRCHHEHIEREDLTAELRQAVLDAWTTRYQMAEHSKTTSRCVPYGKRADPRERGAVLPCRTAGRTAPSAGLDSSAQLGAAEEPPEHLHPHPPLSSVVTSLYQPLLLLLECSRCNMTLFLVPAIAKRMVTEVGLMQPVFVLCQKEWSPSRDTWG